MRTYTLLAVILLSVGSYWLPPLSLLVLPALWCHGFWVGVWIEQQGEQGGAPVRRVEDVGERVSRELSRRN